MSASRPRVRLERAVSLSLLLGLAACGTDLTYWVDSRQQMAIADYYERQGDQAKALAALERATEVASNDRLRIRALRRIPLISAGDGDPAAAKRAFDALERAALLGDRASLEKLAALQLEAGTFSPKLDELIPAYQLVAEAGSDRSAVFLGVLAARGTMPGGAAEADRWWMLAASRGSKDAERQLAMSHSLRDEDEVALQWMMKAVAGDADLASLSLARNFLSGREDFPKDEKRGLHWLTRAAAANGNAAEDVGGLIRKVALGTDGITANRPAGKKLLGILAKRHPARADALRLSIANALIRGEGTRADKSAGLAFVEESAASGSSRGQETLRAHALRIAQGRDGWARNPRKARELAGLLKKKADQALVIAAIEGRVAGSTGTKGALADAKLAAQKGDADGTARAFSLALKQNRQEAMSQIRALLAALESAGQKTVPLDLVLEQRGASGEADAMLVLAERAEARALTNPSDLNTAREWLERAAQAGNAEAQFRLGLALAQGRFGPAQPASAKDWLLKAKAGGSPQAADAIERLGLP